MQPPLCGGHLRPRRLKETPGRLPLLLAVRAHVAQRPQIRAVTVSTRASIARTAGASRLAQVPREVVDYLPRVVLDAVNEGGLAPPQHRQPERIQSWAVNHTAVVAQLALR